MASAFDDDLTEELARIRNPQPAAPPGAAAAPPAAPGEKRGLGGVARDIGSTLDDMARTAVDTASFGLADRALEGLGLEPGAIQKTKEARARSPYATIGGDVAGGLATMAATPLRAIGAGAASLFGGARAGLPGIAGRAAGYGLEGAGVGAGQAAGHTYDLESLPGNVAQGAGIGAAGGALLGPLTPRASLAPRPRAAVPSPDELQFATDVPYAIGRSNPTGVYHTGPAVRGLADDITQDLHSQGFHYRNARNTFASLGMVAEAEREAARAGASPVFSPGNLESIRQAFNKSSKKQDIAASQVAKEAIDNFTANPVASNLSGGTVRGAQSAHDIFETARGNAGANIRSKILRDAEENVDRASATRNSGRNYENNMRSKVAQILASEGRSFPRAEREGLENLARRTDAWNTVREVGNMLGGGGGIGTWVAPAVLGGAAGGGAAYGTGGDPLTTTLGIAAPILAGRTLRGLSNRSMQNAVGQMDDIIRSNSPEFARRQAITPGTVPGTGTTAGTLAGRDAVAEAIIRREQEDPRLRITVNPRRPQ